jgi:hypothetical protein
MRKIKQVLKVTRDIIALTQQQREAALNAWINFSNKEKPSGQTDNANRWFPDKAERCSCCDQVRSPSRSWPWSLYKHCFTLEHKEHLFKAEHEHVLAVKRWLAAQGIDITDCDLGATPMILSNIERDLLIQTVQEASNDAVCSNRRRL